VTSHVGLFPAKFLRVRDVQKIGSMVCATVDVPRIRSGSSPRVCGERELTEHIAPDDHIQ
jgi:hypothetical protein